MAFADDSLDLCAELASDTSVAKNTAIGACDVLRFPPTYLADEYVRVWSSRLNSRYLAIILLGSTLTVVVGCLELEKALAGWRRRWNHYSGWHAVENHTHDSSMDMPFFAL